MYKKILVPLDGSELSERTLPFVEDFALKTGAELVLLTVVAHGTNPGAEGQPFNITTPSPMAGTVLAAASRLQTDRSAAHQSDHEFEPGNARAVAREYLQSIAGGSRDGKPVMTTVVAIGDPASEIAEVAKRERVDLIAIATRGRSGMVRGLLGSVADRTLRIAPVPVLILRSESALDTGDEDRQIQQIIVPLDGSRFAEEALPHASALALALGSKVVLVRAVKYPNYYAMEAYQSASASRVTNMGDIEEDARVYLRKISGRLESDGLDVDLLTTMGSPMALIVKTAERLPGSMVVMTTHGSTGLKRWVLGSVADGVIRTASVPTLAIRPVEIESEVEVDQEVEINVT